MDYLKQHDWPAMQGRRILVVDDSREIASLIKDILCDGYVGPREIRRVYS